MTKRLMACSTLVILVTLSACSQGNSPVNRLKEPAESNAENNEIIEDIITMKEMAIPDLIAMVTEETENDPEKAKQQWFAKVTAMNILAELKASEALPAMEDMLEISVNLSAINNSARTIGRIGGSDAYDILKKVLINTQNLNYTMNSERKKAAIIALGLCENRKAVPLLVRELNNSNDQLTRIYAAGSLAILGRLDGLQEVNDGLSSEDSSIKLAAARAIGLFGVPSSLRTLKGLSGEEVKYVYRKAAMLSQIQIEEKNLPDDKKAAYIEEQLLRNQGMTEMLQWGTMRLKKMNTGESIKSLQNLSVLTSPDSAALKHAAKMRLLTMEQ